MLSYTRFMFVMCGLPGSGKSTVSQKLASRGAIVVSEDAIVTMVHGGDYTKYRADWRDYYRGIEREAIRQAMNGFSEAVVVDRCCPKIETRRRYVSLARDNGYDPILVYFPLTTSDNTLTDRRVNSDRRGYDHFKWRQVVQQMRESFEVPNFREEGFEAQAVIYHAPSFSDFEFEALKGVAGGSSLRVVARSSEDSLPPLVPNPGY